MKGPVEIGRELLVRNTAFNLIGRGVPLLVALVTLPVVVRGLGAERFGVLALAWAVVGYFSVFDVGVSTATTKLIAEAFGRGEHDRVPRIVSTSLLIQMALGLLGGGVLVAGAPLLAERLLNIPEPLEGITKTSFYFLSMAIPVTLLSGPLRAALEAAQRFDLVNSIRASLGTATFLLPFLGVVLGLDVPGIVLLLTLARGLSLAVYYTFYRRVVAGDAKGLPLDIANELRPLLTFGGWVTLSSLAMSGLVYMDRFVIGTVLTISAVAYYTVPLEIVLRLSLVPASFTATLFPAFSLLRGRGREDLDGLYARSAKLLLSLMSLIVATGFVLAGPILSIMLGADFTEESRLVFQILLVGVLINSVSWIGYSLLVGVGRPDVQAKLVLVEFPIYVAALWGLLQWVGIVGAALAWSLRLALDALLLHWQCWKISLVSLRTFTRTGLLGSILNAVLLMGTAGVLSTLQLEPWESAVALLVSIAFFGALFWLVVLDEVDRGIVLELRRGLVDRVS